MIAAATLIVYLTGLIAYVPNPARDEMRAFFVNAQEEVHDMPGDHKPHMSGLVVHRDHLDGDPGTDNRPGVELDDGYFYFAIGRERVWVDESAPKKLEIHESADVDDDACPGTWEESEYFNWVAPMDRIAPFRGFDWRVYDEPLDHPKLVRGVVDLTEGKAKTASLMTVTACSPDRNETYVALWEIDRGGVLRNYKRAIADAVEVVRKDAETRVQICFRSLSDNSPGCGDHPLKLKSDADDRIVVWIKNVPYDDMVPDEVQPLECAGDPLDHFAHMFRVLAGSSWRASPWIEEACGNLAVSAPEGKKSIGNPQCPGAQYDPP